MSEVDEPGRAPISRSGWCRRLLASLAVVTMGAVLLAGTPALATSQDSPVRIAGNNRYDTGARIAQAWPAGVAVGYVVNGEDFPDALAAAARAGAQQAPVLLTRPGSLPPETARTLERLRPARLVVVGGPASVSDEVLAELRQYTTTGAVERVSGTDRYATAAAVASHYPRSPRTAYLASGADFPDALAGAALAGHQQAPLLLTRADRLDARTVEELSRLAPQQVVVLGGDLGVSDAVARQAAGYTTSKTFRRIAGTNRYQTAALIASEFPAGVTPAYVASGESFPDALVGAALAARAGVPMVLTPSDRVHPGTDQALVRQQPDAMFVLGGSITISDSTFDALAKYLVPRTETFTPRATTADFTWAGQTWRVKETPSSGPGPNRWHRSSVELGDQGSLKLRVKKNADGQWEAGEVQRVGRTGYGTFTYRTTSSVVPANDRSVLGLFSYQHASPAEGYEEIDIEYSRWGRPGVGPGSLSVHKPDPHWYREFPLTHTGPMTHSFLWAPGYVRWTITRDDTGAVVHSRELWGDAVPAFVDARMHLNLWLLDGQAPETGEPFEVVLSSASWTPLPAGFVAPADPGPAKTATLTDAFSAGIDRATWPGALEYGTPQAVGGRLRVPLGPGYSGVQSAAEYSLDGSSLTVEQIRPATTHSESESELAFVADAANSVHLFALGSATGLARVRTDGVNSDVRFPYDPGKHRWLRVRSVGSTLYFEGSPDRVTWTRLVPARPSPAWVATAVGHVKLGGGNWQTGDSGRAVEFDNLNRPAG